MNSNGKKCSLNKFGTPFQFPLVDRTISNDFDSILKTNVVSFVNLSRQIGDELTTMSEEFLRLFNEQKRFLQYARENRKPMDEEKLNALIKPQSVAIESISVLKNENRRSTFFNHLSSVSEGIPAFGWILISPSPTTFIKEMIDATQFYTNRVLKDFKDKDSIHVRWVETWLKILNDLHLYVKQHHPTGLNWSMTSNNSFSRNVTTNLKKTSEESMKIGSNDDKSKFVLEGNKWLVENQTNRNDLKIIDVNMKQTVYIYKCSNCFITIVGKVNSIVVDQCEKVDLHITSVVSLVEFINSRKVKCQLSEQVPTIQIEKTDGCHIYLSKTSFNTEFVTSKSSEMTINVPVENGDFKEFPIPEQFKTSLKNNGKQLVTIPTEFSGV